MHLPLNIIFFSAPPIFEKILCRIHRRSRTLINNNSSNGGSNGTTPLIVTPTTDTMAMSSLPTQAFLNQKIKYPYYECYREGSKRYDPSTGIFTGHSGILYPNLDDERVFLLSAFKFHPKERSLNSKGKYFIVNKKLDESESLQKANILAIVK